MSALTLPSHPVVLVHIVCAVEPLTGRLLAACTGERYRPVRVSELPRVPRRACPACLLLPVLAGS